MSNPAPRLSALLFLAVWSSAVLAEPLKLGGTGGALGYLTEITKNSEEFRDAEIVSGLGSGGANKALIAGVLDVSISGRPLKDSERAAGLKATPLLQTPFAFFTSRAAPVDVAKDQIWRLYSDLGGPNDLFDGDRVRVILREVPDSDLSFAINHVPGFEQAYDIAKDVPGVPFVTTDQQNAELAERAFNSLTTGTLVQMVSERRALNAISIDGVAPSADTLASGRYPYLKTFFVVYRPENAARAQRFVDFLYSDDGRQRAKSLGALIVD